MTRDHRIIVAFDSNITGARIPSAQRRAGRGSPALGSGPRLFLPTLPELARRLPRTGGRLAVSLGAA